MTTISASKQTAVIYTGQASPQPWTITQMDPPETRWQPPPECSTPERYKFQISRNASTITVDGTSTMQQMRMYHLYKMGCGRDSEECCPEGWGWNGFYTPAWIPGGKMFTATPYVELGGDTTILDPQIWHFSTVSARVLCPRYDNFTIFGTSAVTPGWQYLQVIRFNSNQETDKADSTLLCKWVATTTGTVNGTEILTINMATAAGTLIIDPENPTTILPRISSTSNGPDPTGTPPPPPPADSDKPGLPTGAIAGIAIAILLPVIVASIFFIYRLKRRSRDSIVPEGLFENHKPAYSGDAGQTDVDVPASKSKISILGMYKYGTKKQTAVYETEARPNRTGYYETSVL